MSLNGLMGGAISETWPEGIRSGMSLVILVAAGGATKRTVDQLKPLGTWALWDPQEMTRSAARISAEVGLIGGGLACQRTRWLTELSLPVPR